MENKKEAIKKLMNANLNKQDVVMVLDGKEYKVITTIFSDREAEIIRNAREMEVRITEVLK